MRTQAIGAVGHRVVHGGEEFTGSVLINDAVLASIEKTAHLAPLHNPPNLAGIRAAMHALPNAPQVACFDTAFHATIPPVAYTYALPYELYEKLGVRRYGFHGTSHRYVARRAAAILGRDKYDINCITCHLGNGSSITAVRDGHSVDTSMGLTPLEGLVMGTRCGDIDPAILFYLAENGYTVAAAQRPVQQEERRAGHLRLLERHADARRGSSRRPRAGTTGDRCVLLPHQEIHRRLLCRPGPRRCARVHRRHRRERGRCARADLRRPRGAWHQARSADETNPRSARKRRIDVEDGGVAVLVIPTDEEGVIAADTYQLATAKAGRTN